MSINLELMTIWVEVLGSGAYLQTTGKLRDDTSFCPYGVLCDIVEPNGWEQLTDPENHRSFWSHGGYVLTCPQDILEELMGEPNKQPMPLGRSINKLNDSMMLTFTEIAQELRACYLE